MRQWNDKCCKQVAKNTGPELSVHPTMTNAEIDFIMDAIELTVGHFKEWAKDYAYDAQCNEYAVKGIVGKEQSKIENWFNVSRWEIKREWAYPEPIIGSLTNKSEFKN